MFHLRDAGISVCQQHLYLGQVEVKEVEVEAVQHVHLANIPVWFGLLGSIKDGCM